jgi:hypothetical protein
MESLGATYQIRTTLPAAAHFTEPAYKNTKDMPYDIKGNEQPRRGSGGGFDSSPIPVEEPQGGDVTEMLPETGGRLPQKEEFNTGRNSGRTNNEQPQEENGPGTNMPAEETGAVEAGGEAGRALEAAEALSLL